MSSSSSHDVPRSAIPVPRAATRVQKPAAPTSRFGMPASHTIVAGAAKRNVSGSGMTLPGASTKREAMTNATNRTMKIASATNNAAAGRKQATSVPTADRRRILSASGKAAAAGKEEGADSADLFSAMAELKELFELEQSKVAKQLAVEKSQREEQESKVRQLEEDLLEQRRVAKDTKKDLHRRKTIDQEEIMRLSAKHARDVQALEEELERERRTVSTLKDTLAGQSGTHLTYESTVSALRTKLAATVDELEAEKRRFSQREALMQETLRANAALENELREAESLRRKLHNEVQELRGNIRVFARVRPSTDNDARNGAQTLAAIRFPDEREAAQIEVLEAGESATGTATMKTHAFRFDRVFRPDSTQSDVFEEIAHLTQSVLDGYNTSIFAYGQTGSGKTHTLEGSAELSIDASSDPSSDPEAGMIPRVVQMLWRTAQHLEDKGWQYQFEGQILEIYNDNINDLLGKEKVDSAKHEIKHENGRTTVSGTVVAPLHSPSEVFSLLAKAKTRRQVAATLMNDRSSRGHSVFMLRVRGQNATTLESCDAVLSLVDLAGSERLSNSGSGNDPARLKEAQNINKSLSSLADVIAALGQNKPNAHIPYRNSTLTWLLRNSLGGNSKTLMLLALSPMASHLGESLCSLRFATKVNSTVIGTARKVVRKTD